MTHEIAVHVDPMKEFQERVQKKLREDIGAMLPDEVLQALIKKAVEEEFFKERISRGTYGNETERRPSWFVEAVAKAAKPMLQQHVEAWVEANKDVLKKALQEFMTKENLLLLAMAQMRSTVAADMSDIATTIVTRIKGGY